MWAANAGRPAKLNEVFEGRVGIGEILDGLHQGLEFLNFSVHARIIRAMAGLVKYIVTLITIASREGPLFPIRRFCSDIPPEADNHGLPPSLDAKIKWPDIEGLSGMKHARHVIAVTLMATAICADRIAPAAPAQPPATHFTTRLIERLTTNLRRVLPAVTLYQPHRLGLGINARRPLAITDQAFFVAPSLSPFRFRLPPPLA
jgi:hypothetical protein